MQKAIVKDIFFLQQKSAPATKADLFLAQDLQDTLLAHRESCVGLAANMIGVQKRVIIFMYGVLPMLMFNPVLIQKSGPYQVEEGCLSLPGSRQTTRYQKITIEYLDQNWLKKIITLEDFSAQICQHELDHLEGILI
ncbi:peptide deformylase [Streptococcus sinensis]|uniref:peptide deformylase n=1 Tax=Streptococcus sinensis TaxID=176090 RepID=UPI00272A0358|nr:peptide deformylase [Streptococcus sinensis]